EIAFANVARIEAELARGHIHQPLHDEGRGRPPDAAIGAGRRLRRCYRTHAPAIMRNAIGAGQEAHHLHRLERGGPRIDRIGTDVADGVGDKPDDLSVAIEAELRLDDLVKAVAGRRQILETVAAPFHGTAELACGDADEKVFGIERALAAEAAADI